MWGRLHDDEIDTQKLVNGIIRIAANKTKNRCTVCVLCTYQNVPQYHQHHQSTKNHVHRLAENQYLKCLVEFPIHSHHRRVFLVGKRDETFGHLVKHHRIGLCVLVLETFARKSIHETFLSQFNFNANCCDYKYKQQSNSARFRWS